MRDWESELTEEEAEQWAAFVTHARRELLEKVATSVMVISLVPDEPDVKFALETGFAILLDKPIVLVAAPGVKVPEKLRRAADEVLVLDVDVEEDREVLSARLVDFGDKLDLGEDNG